ncbi:4-hydroxy-tetrahydrodipicolinate reductase [Clostridiaceae bacterium]|nr:4-hydroxy-tetrahydrodipicolinate reductase [Clostridiaceae bacterium]RKI11206.1 4-hydroxy-tetrahydrodipicolinate reductase [bacterium 1XD21-70]
MTRMIMHGCNGAMGQVISGLAADMADLEIVAGIDPDGRILSGYPVYKSLELCDAAADVIVDFTTAAAVDGLLEYCRERKMPLVLCTTGLSEGQVKQVERAAAQTAILRSANMSLGINTLLKLLQDAAKVLAGAGFDVEIVEKHHNRKVDAPSGTALALADSVNEAMGHAYHYQYDRASKRGKRDPHEIGIQAVRGGTIVGEHEVVFAGQDEVVTFSHTAYSKAVFAKGALEAARFLAGKEPGLYTMADVIASAT